MNASTAIADSLLRQACQESKPTGGKVLIRCDLIERSGSSEAWYEEAQPIEGKVTIRPHVIEGGGSSEAWYGGLAA